MYKKYSINHTRHSADIGISEKLMKIYTGTGDQGKTSLFSGERISKANQRIEAYGDVDELSSAIGALSASIEAEKKELITQLHQIQSYLFNLGSWLATTQDSPSVSLLDTFSDEPSKNLEHSIDRMEENLPTLKGFILPGGTVASAWAHLARTICRRAERHVIRYLESESNPLDSDHRKSMITYLNRLSDYFFVLARYLNHLSGVKDQLWKK
jgi:cob(I)alamin adenosyltransferase